MFSRQKKLSDIEVIVGLQNHDKNVEKWFFNSFSSYFNLHFNQIFFDEDKRREIFQTAIIKLWTEIENKTIYVVEDKVCRISKREGRREMTASLETFMMCFAKNEFRELLRNIKEDNLEEILRSGKYVETPEDSQDDFSAEFLIQVVDDCIGRLSKNCVEIITMFYYEKKTLDEIMELRGGQNSSKDGLKTAKNKCMGFLRGNVRQQLKLNGYG